METENLIKEAARLAQDLISNLYVSDPKNDMFTQTGFLDGEKTVLDYIAHGELGVALEHLLYTIHEANIKFPKEMVVNIHKIARDLDISNPYSRMNLAKKTEDLKSLVYNKP